MIRRVFLPFLVFGVTACGDDGVGTDPIACTDDTGSVEVTVTTGASVRFDWEPACSIALLLVEQEASDRWSIMTDEDQWADPAYQANRFAPPVTYGADPQGVHDSFGPENLLSGVTYELILWRVLPENSTAVCQSQFENVCLMAVAEFVR